LLKPSGRNIINPHKKWPKREEDAPASSLISKSFVQGALRWDLKQPVFVKCTSIHTLRRSYATHLLGAGVNICHIRQHPGYHKYPNRKGKQLEYSVVTITCNAEDVKALFVSIP